MTELCSHYQPEQLALIIDFVRRCHPLTEAEIRKLRAGGELVPAPGADNKPP